MSRPPSDRRHRIADAAIAVLAREGLRGLTHRAVDREAGLPAGSTSYYARTRNALLDAAVHRLAELDLAGAGQPEPPATAAADAPGVTDLAAVVELLAATVWEAMTGSRERMLARYELSLEATRRPELRATLDRAGRRFRELMSEILAGAGSTEPDRHGRMFVAYLDGIIFDSVAGAGSAHPPSREELRKSLRELLAALVPAGGTCDGRCDLSGGT